MHIQFPIKLAFAFTINKSQGQSLKQVGVYLPQPVFSHGQLYVALSRAIHWAQMKILIEPTFVQGNIHSTGNYYTTNVVYDGILDT